MDNDGYISLAKTVCASCVRQFDYNPTIEQMVSFLETLDEDDLISHSADELAEWFDTDQTYEYDDMVGG